MVINIRFNHSLYTIVGTIKYIVAQLNLTPDEKLHKEQSSLENMLMDQIIYRDSAYILNMSKEEAIDLTIPDSLYVHYLKIVDDLNTLQ